MVEIRLNWLLALGRGILGKEPLPDNIILGIPPPSLSMQRNGTVDARPAL
jgi:hypothetical protein